MRNLLKVLTRKRSVNGWKTPGREYIGNFHFSSLLMPSPQPQHVGSLMYSMNTKYFSTAKLEAKICRKISMPEGFRSRARWPPISLAHALSRGNFLDNTLAQPQIVIIYIYKYSNIVYVCIYLLYKHIHIYIYPFLKHRVLIKNKIKSENRLII